LQAAQPRLKAAPPLQAVPHLHAAQPRLKAAPPLQAVPHLQVVQPRLQAVPPAPQLQAVPQQKVLQHRRQYPLHLEVFKFGWGGIAMEGGDRNLGSEIRRLSYIKRSGLNSIFRGECSGPRNHRNPGTASHPRG
jgi:hypothetical protein